MVIDFRYVVIAILVVSNAFFIERWRAANERYANFKSSVEMAQKQAEAEALRKEEEYRRVNQEVVAGWSAAVDWYRKHPRIVRVRVRDNRPAQVPAISAPAASDDEVATEPRFDTGGITAIECEERLNNAILDAAQVIWLQEWIRQQREVAK